MDIHFDYPLSPDDDLLPRNTVRNYLKINKMGSYSISQYVQVIQPTSNVRILGCI